jgi:hypothetical protein
VGCAELAAERTTPVTPPATKDAPSASADAHTAVRVAIAGRSNDEGGVAVRLLGSGAKAMKGEIEALLVPLAAGVDLRDL